MGALSFRERRALQLRQEIHTENMADPFDADYDPSEVPRVVPLMDHISFRQHRREELPTIDVAEARQRLAAAKALIRTTNKVKESQDRSALANIVCWHNTPELYRKMVARAAGLSADVVNKLDRDLTETEKAMLRSALSDMRLYFSALAAL